MKANFGTFCDIFHGQYFRFTPIILPFFDFFHAHFYFHAHFFRFFSRVSILLFLQRKSNFFQNLKFEIQKCHFLWIFTGKNFVSRPVLEGFSSFFTGTFFFTATFFRFFHGENYFFHGGKNTAREGPTLYANRCYGPERLRLFLS